MHGEKSFVRLPQRDLISGKVGQQGEQHAKPNWYLISAEIVEASVSGVKLLFYLQEIKQDV